MRHDPADVLPAIRVLLTELENQEIQYVVIGRQSRIGPTLSGHGDLDILVSKEDGRRAEMVLLRLGFQEQTARSHEGAVGDFMRRDTSSGQLLRVQLHYELRLGFALAPAFRIPTAGHLIPDSGLQGLVRVPSASDHLALHLVKGLLAWEASDLLAQGRHPFDPEEVRLLLPGVAGEDFIGSVDRIFPPLPSQLVGRIFIEAVRCDRGETGVSARLRLTILSMAVRDSLLEWSDLSLFLAWLRSARRRFARLFSLRSHQPGIGGTDALGMESSEPMPAR